MNKDLKNHLVAVLPQAPGRYKFPSGSVFIRTENGQAINAKPKNYKSKAERKALKRLRVAEREENALLAIERDLK